MAESKKHKNKKKKKQYYGSVFAPLFPYKLGTPKTNSGYGGKPWSGGGGKPGGTGSMGMAIGGGSVGSAVGSGAGVAGVGGAAESKRPPPGRNRAIIELKKILGLTEATADPTWVGSGAPGAVAIGVGLRQGPPYMTGPGFSDVEIGHGGVYNFEKSPGLGFRTEKAWKVWKAVVDIIGRIPTYSMHAILQAAMQRAGVRFSDLDMAELRLLEMGIEWYLSNPGKFQQAKDSSGGPTGGLGANQLTPNVA